MFPSFGTLFLDCVRIVLQMLGLLFVCVIGVCVLLLRLALVACVPLEFFKYFALCVLSVCVEWCNS